MNKFLYRPTYPFIIHQKFGENKACVNDDNKVITCDGNNPPAGFRSLYGPNGHAGLDLKADHGQPVYCAAPGRVSFIDTQPRSGLDVRIDTEINGVQFRHIYEHLLGYQPKIGDVLEVGDLIGWADNTGYSSGDHCHFQLNQLINGNWVPVDPLPYMYDTFALHVNMFKRLKESVARLSEMIADWLRKPKL